MTDSTPAIADVRDALAGTDVYLLDCVLRGLVDEDARVVDVGCGGGRNLTYFMRRRMDVRGVDRDARAIERVRRRARDLGVDDVEARFRIAEADATELPDATADLVIANAILHFARDEEHFEAITGEIRRLLAPGGLAFCRLASDVGIAHLMRPAQRHASPRWRRMPDGSDRFVVDLDFLENATERLGASLEGPIKTVNVQNRRCMTTWLWRRSP